MTQEEQLAKWVFEPAHRNGGMTRNNIMDFGGLAVGEKVNISCQIELLKQL